MLLCKITLGLTSKKCSAEKKTRLIHLGMPSVAQPHLPYGWKLTSSNFMAKYFKDINYYS